MRFSVHGSEFKAYLDNEIILSASDVASTRGRVGLKTQGSGSGCRFRNINVTAPDGRLLFQGLPRLPEVIGIRGHWTCEGDDLVQSSREPDTEILFGDPSWSHYDVSLEVRKDGEESKDGQRFTVYFHRQDRNNGCWYSGYNDAHEVASVVEGKWSRAWKGRRDTWTWSKNDLLDGRWYAVSIKVRGATVQCYFDNKLMFDETHPVLTHGRIGLGSFRAPVRFRRITVTDPNGGVLMEGLPTLGPTASASVGLSGPALPRSAGAPERQLNLAYAASSRMIDNSIGMKLMLIPAGEFQMGSPDSDNDASADEKPQHRVRITRPFYLGVTEVTQGQYRAITGENPSHFKGSDDLPVEQVSWNDAIAFCNKLSEREGLKPYYQSGGAQSGGDGYRLPTEAEWEYACRAGATTRFCSGDADASLGEYAWFYANSGNKTHPVGQKHPNVWGLYDMHGNVYEWCGDGYAADYDRGSPDADPRGSLQAADRVDRGGCWGSVPQVCRAANRYGLAPGFRSDNLGFRLARVQSGR
jgi:formylglycine-generating enzyme required for sulfatase activity